MKKYLNVETIILLEPSTSITLQKLLSQITQQKDTNTALKQVLQRYEQLETEYWTKQDLAFRQKWNMDFDAFYQLQHHNNSEDMIEELFDWETANSNMLFYKKIRINEHRMNLFHN